MATDITALFDTLLVLAGLVLVATGLVMFIRSKTSTQASSVEAFGIKLNVTHPSLILVLAGVGLMLAPRLLPEMPGKADKPPAVVADAATPQAAAPTAPIAPAAPAPAGAPAVVAPASSTALSQASSPAKSAATPAAAPAAASAPRAEPPAPAPVKKPSVRVASGSAAVAPSVVTPVPAAAEAARPAPVPATQAARPTLAYAALGVPTNRSFWSGETRASYSPRLRAAIQQAAREGLGMDARDLGLSPAEFDAWWNESGQQPRSRELCAASGAPRALLSARVETPFALSSVESAFWPELKLRLYVCAHQRGYRQQKVLSPQNDDAWPFSVEFSGELERFLRAYRGDWAD